MTRSVLVLLLLVVAVTTHLPAQAQVKLSRSVIGNGGGTMTGGNYVVWNCTAGQTATDVLTGALYKSESGFWCNGTSTILTGVGDPRDIPKPRYYLSQNYPNPFNRVTTLQFSVKTRGRVKIVLYDVAGREVKTVLDEVVDPGIRTVALDGTDLPNGVYFCRMQTGDFVEAKKLLHVK